MEHVAGESVTGIRLTAEVGARVGRIVFSGIFDGRVPMGKE